MSHAAAVDRSVLDEYQAEWRMLRERPPLERTVLILTSHQLPPIDSTLQLA
jgi:hypothetical protein